MSDGNSEIGDLIPYWQIMEIFSTHSPKIRFPGYESDGFVEIFSTQKI